MRIPLRRFTVLALASAIFLGAPAAWAEDENAGEEAEVEKEEERKGWGRKDEDPWERMPKLEGKTKERIETARVLFSDDEFEKAELELGKLFMNRLNPAEEAAVHELYGDLAFKREDNDEARRRYALARATEDRLGIKPDRALALDYKIAMLHLTDENWEEAIRVQEAWFEDTAEAAEAGHVSPPNARAYFTLAVSYYQNEQLDKAVTPAEKAVELGKPPQETWLGMLLAIRLRDKKYEEALPVLEQLISLYPSKRHFMNLSTVYGALGRLEEAAIPLQLAHAQGYLTKDEELRRLAQMLMYVDLPYRAARVLEAGLESEVLEPDVESLSMLGNSWIGARDYEAAIEPLSRAASIAEDGELYVRLAQVHMQRDNWGGATEALRKGIEKGGLKDPGDANLLMGIASYSEEKPEQALSWFRRAKGFESKRAEAEVWITHVETELATAAAAAEAAELEAAESQADAPPEELEAASARQEGEAAGG